MVFTRNHSGPFFRTPFGLRWRQFVNIAMVIVVLHVLVKPIGIDISGEELTAILFSIIAMAFIADRKKAKKGTM